MKVAKFGGSSVNNARAFKIVADIIGRDPSRKVIVVSAVFGITDHLIKLSKLSVSKKVWRDSFDELIKRHSLIIQELEVELDLSNYFKDLEIFLLG
ncbi:aspartate kinase, partial [bacterium]|nr:aspartate kinase [bacterium]